MDIFYHAMNYSSKGIIDASCYGDFMRRSAEKARQLIEDLAKYWKKELEAVLRDQLKKSPTKLRRPSI